MFLDRPQQRLQLVLLPQPCSSYRQRGTRAAFAQGCAPGMSSRTWCMRRSPMCGSNVRAGGVWALSSRTWFLMSPPQVPSSSVWKSQLREGGLAGTALWPDCPSLLSQRIARVPLTCSCHNPTYDTSSLCPDRFTTSSTPSPKQREQMSSASSAPMSARLALPPVQSHRCPAAPRLRLDSALQPWGR